MTIKTITNAILGIAVEITYSVSIVLAAFLLCLALAIKI